jgi:hypothetical protein
LYRTCWLLLVSVWLIIESFLGSVYPLELATEPVVNSVSPLG